MRLFAEPRSLEAIVRQIKASGRAYPVFELGRLFLAGRDRYIASFSRQTPPPAKRPAKGEPVPEAEPLEGPAEIFQVITDSSLWLTREEAIRHILHGAGIQNFYRRETVSIDPPKGIFTAVAVCGFSGEVLGPPNHHSFQSTVARLHRERFSNIPIDRYKSRIRTEKDEAQVAKWLENQSTTTVYVPVTPEEVAAAAAKAKADAAAPTPASTAEKPAAAEESTAEPATEEASAAGAPEENAAAAAASASEEIPEEFVRAPGNEAAAPPAAVDAPAPLKTQAEMEAHFLQHHAPNAVKAVTRAKVPGSIPGKLLAPPLLALLRMEVEQQQRFPMQLVQDLCRDLEKQSLKFFKRDRKATFVCRTRPHYIADEAHLSPRLRSIVGVVRGNPGITLSRLVSTLAPHVELSSKPSAPVAPASEAAAPAAAEAPVEVKPHDTPEAVTAPVAEAPPAGEPAAAGIPEVEAVSAEAAAESAVESVATDPAPETGSGEAASEPAAETESEPASAAPAEPAGAEEPGTPVETTSSTESPAEAVAKTAAVAEASPLAAPAPAAAPHLTADEIAVLQDLRWLVQEGYVTEFASGELQILGRPPQPAPEKKEKEKSPPAAAAAPAPAVAESGAEAGAKAETPAADQSATEETAGADPEAEASAPPASEETPASDSVAETEPDAVPEAEAGKESAKTED
ncbi:MAG: hypothetical protein JWM59_706 [Verrucomicrobiales bacterium]|nr:hypothetical protein [Verrucomicrobiales bacterium]